MAKKKRKRIASRGSVNDIILKTLLSGDKYGYEIIKEVEEYSEGKIQLKQPSLYSSLSRFEEKGFVTSYWGDSDIGGRRHYYHLTDTGKSYFDNKNSNKKSPISILKATPSNSNELQLQNKDTVILENTNDSTAYSKSLDTKNDEIKNITMEEIKDIPAFLNFDKCKTNEDEIIPDHNFYVQTPIENSNASITKNSNTLTTTQNINNFSEEKNDNSIVESNTISSKNSQEELIWKQLAEKVKNNNKKIANSKYSQLFFKKPKKSKIVILDKDGIYKLRDSDYIPTTNSPAKIIDNVGKRIEKNIDPYTGYSSNYSKTTPTKELSDEERKQRNENFLAKFNLLTKSKMKPVVEKKIEEKPKIEVDYRKKLDAFINNEIENENAFDQIKSEEPSQNNLFNYVEDEETSFSNSEEEKEISNDFVKEENFEEDADDKFINFDPIEFETKNDDKKYIEEISNYSSTHNDIQINKYENKSNAILSDKSYVLINKVKSIFGIVLFLLMMAEITITMFIFKKYNLIFESDKKLFVASYIIAILLSLIFIMPVLFNSNEHKINSFKLKISMIFGILTFLISTILVYCINSLLGFDLTNFDYFAAKLILPIILTFNFVITPPIYSLIIKNKKFYDWFLFLDFFFKNNLFMI